MPKIPDYGFETTVSGPGGIVPVADIGGAVRGIAGGLFDLAAKQKEIQGRQEVSDVNVKLAKARSEWTVELQKRAAEAPAGDMTFAETFNEDFNEYISTLGENYSTAAGKQAWMEGSAKLGFGFAESAGIYQIESAGKKAKQDYLAALDFNRNSLTHDPSQFQSVLAETMAALDDPNGIYSKMPSDTREALKNQTRNDLAISAWNGLARMNPNEALRQLKAGDWDQYVDADKMYALEGRAQTLLRAQEVEIMRGAAAAEKATREGSRAALDQVIRDTYSDAPKLTAQDVANDDNMQPADKLTALSIIERSTKPDPMAEISHRNASDLFARLHLPDSDPNKIVDESVLNNAFINGDLNRTDLDWLRKESQAARTPEGDMLGKRMTDFFNAIEPQINQKGMFGLPTDPAGAEQNYRFQDMVRRKVAEYREAKKDPYALFDPSSPEYLGKPETIGSYKKSLNQQIQGITGGLNIEGNAAPNAVEAPAPETFSLNGRDEPVEEKKVINGITYYKVGGQWYSK